MKIRLLCFAAALLASAALGLAQGDPADVPYTGPNRIPGTPATPAENVDYTHVPEPGAASMVLAGIAAIIGCSQWRKKPQRPPLAGRGGRPPLSDLLLYNRDLLSH